MIKVLYDFIDFFIEDFIIFLLTFLVLAHSTEMAVDIAKSHGNIAN